MSKDIKKSQLPDIDVILKLLEKGVSQTEIAQKYGVSRQAVSKKIKEFVKSTVY